MVRRKKGTRETGKDRKVGRWCVEREERKERKTEGRRKKRKMRRYLSLVRRKKERRETEGRIERWEGSVL